MAEKPTHLPSSTDLVETKSISDQLSSGIYMVFMDRSVDIVNREGLAFVTKNAYFCIEPYSTCAHPMPGERYLHLQKSCNSCWKLQDKLVELLQNEDYRCFNLIHWGPDNKQHATMLGPLTPEQYEKCAILINTKYPELHRFTTTHTVIH